MVAIEQFIARLSSTNPSFRVSGPQSESAVSAVEQALGVSLPQDYRSFLRQFGALHLPGEGISGIWDGDPLLSNEGSAYGDTMRLRADFHLSPRFVVVEPDAEAPYCLDTTDIGEACPVICYELAHGTLSRIAPSFQHFLSEWLTLRLPDT